jgi:hypothetical protein
VDHFIAREIATREPVRDTRMMEHRIETLEMETRGLRTAVDSLRETVEQLVQALQRGGK